MTIVQTHWIQQDLATSSRVDSSRIVVAAPYCDVSLTASDESDIADAACTWPGTSFFYPASAMPYRNFEVAIQALTLLQAQGHHAELTLTITGMENDYSKIITTLAKPLGDAVQFFGPISRRSVPVTLHHSIRVFPSAIETFGLPPLEGRKLGSWVIAADTPFAREILNEYWPARFLLAILLRTLHPLCRPPSLNVRWRLPCRLWQGIKALNVERPSSPVPGKQLWTS